MLITFHLTIALFIFKMGSQLLQISFINNHWHLLYYYMKNIISLYKKASQVLLRTEALFVIIH